MILITWLGFFISLLTLLVVSRKNLGMALILSAFILGFFTLSLPQIWIQFFSVLSDLSVIFLSLAIGVIPLIGGVLKESGMLDSLVNNLKLKRRIFLMLSPALMGLLPLPGGSLLSAPVVEKAGKKISAEMKAGINIWYRHIFLLIYPLNPFLIISVKLAGLEVYDVIPFLIPFFIFTVLLGYFYFLRKIKEESEYKEKMSLRELSYPLAVLLLAPLLDFSLSKIFPLEIREFFTFIAISSSLLLALFLSKFPLTKIKKIGREMKLWNFFLIILGMFLYLNVLKASGIGELIASLTLSKILLGLCGGFLLALFTGRVEVPASIIIPIFLTTYSLNFLHPLTFTFIYFAMFLGYVISPLHPCVSVSLEYFKIKLGSFLKLMLFPTFLAFVLTFILAVIFGL